MYLNNGDPIDLKFDQLDNSLPKETEIYNAVYKRHMNINYIIHTDTTHISAVSYAGITLRPLLDDFAQIVGTSVRTVAQDPVKIAAALKGTSAVFIRNHGTLCCGSSKRDATAVCMVMEKACKALIGATFFGKIKPINYLESSLMRLVYLKKYSKQANI